MSEKNKTIQLNFKALGIAILHRWPLIVIPVLVLPIAFWLLENKLPQRYSVRAQILVQDSVSVNPFLEDMSVPWTVRERLPVIEAILISRATLEKTLRHLGEIKKDMDPQTVDDMIRQMRSQLSVYGMRGGLVNIDFVGYSPERLYKGLVFLVDVLVEATLRPQKQSLEEASHFLDKQITQIREDLVELEKKIEQFKKENAEELPEVFQANLQSYMSTQTSLIEGQTELRAARMRKKNLEQRLRVYNPVARELESSLIQAKTKLSELQAKYTDEHPEIVALKAHIAQLKKERRAANLKVTKNVNFQSLQGAAKMRSVDVGVGRGASSSAPGGNIEARTDDLFTSDLLEYKAITAEIAALEGTVSELNRHGRDTLDSVKSFATTERVLTSLLRDFEVKQNTYTTLLARAEEAKITKALSMFDEDQQIVLIESPRMPTSPIGIIAKLNASIGVVIGLLLGITLVILMELISGTVRDARDIEAITGLPVMGTMPLLYGDDSHQPMKYLRRHDPKST